MNDFGQALYTAASLVGHFDAELRAIVFLSLGVSLTASFCAFAVDLRWAQPWPPINSAAEMR